MKIPKRKQKNKEKEREQIMKRNVGREVPLGHDSRMRVILAQLFLDPLSRCALYKRQCNNITFYSIYLPSAFRKHSLHYLLVTWGKQITSKQITIAFAYNQYLHRKFNLSS